MTESATRTAPSGNHHEVPVHEIVLLYETDPDHGLSEDDAQRRHDQFGPNTLPRLDRRGPVVRLLLQFHHPLIYVLLAAAAATIVLGEFVDASVILGVVVLNAIIGYVQESRAEQALDALVAMVRTEATVIRDGMRRRIPSDEVVPGDLIVLHAGDKVPADLRLSKAQELQIDESALTGESVPVIKQPVELPAETTLADRINMAYSSTLVSRGGGRGIAVATGADTEIGRIHRLVGEAKTLQTPLTRKIARFSRLLTVAILSLAALTFVLGLIRGEDPGYMLTAAVALAVGAIPEGLPAVVTITLAIGVARMARRRAIIRKLPAVETLGSTTVIGTDKTGTLTANAMTVTTVVAGGLTYQVTGTGYAPRGDFRTAAGGPVEFARHPALQDCLVTGVLCNDSRLAENDGRWSVIGDPTEGALLTAAAKAGFDQGELRASYPKLDSWPFDSERGYMATLNKNPGGTVDVHVKGALERVLDMASAQLNGDGTTGPLDPDQVHAHADRLASQALRVLVHARAEVPPSTTELAMDLIAGRLVVLGLQAMYDPPRQDAIVAVGTCQRAGIEVKMITGDHATTARAIAERFGLTGPDGERPVIMTGEELSALAHTAWPGAVEDTTVFARVSPEQKLRLVETMQAQGHVVAMTGDGVNDAPALRRADIGVAMGIGGTEVAKEAADMVLTDDDFASIEAAVEEGRGVFDNLRKFITWVLPTSIGEGLLILTAIVLATRLPILPVQILWINMTTAVALGLALAFEPLEPGIMRRPPLPSSRPILTRELVVRIAFVAAIMVVAGFSLFQWELAMDVPIEEARTVAVNVIVFIEVAYLLNCRSLERSMLRIGIFSNRWIWVGIATMTGLQLLYTYTPWMQSLFRSAPIDTMAWLRILAVAAIAFVLVEVDKAIHRMWVERHASRP